MPDPLEKGCEMMPEVKIDVDLACEECGKALDGTDKGGGEIAVVPCEKCLESAKDDGDSEGYDRGYEDGYKEGEAEASDA